MDIITKIVLIILDNLDNFLFSYISISKSLSKSRILTMISSININITGNRRNNFDHNANPTLIKVIEAPLSNLKLFETNLNLKKSQIFNSQIKICIKTHNEYFLLLHVEGPLRRPFQIM